MFQLKHTIILIFFGLFTTCLPLKAKIALPTDKNRPFAKSITSWEIHGGIAAKNKSQKGWSATLHWLQTGPQCYQIRLMGPLGNGSLMISKQGNVVSFQSGHKKYTSNNAEALLLKHTGIRLPVSNLYYWIRGLPAPGPIQSKIYDKSKHLQTLKQSGYRIDFNKYISIQGFTLPTLIRLEGNGLLVKVIIKRWEVMA